MKRITIAELERMRSAGERITMLTCYDASFAQLCEEAGVDCLLIGDSLGMVLQGHDSTLPVRLEDIAYHTACVARRSTRALIIADMPFGSYQESPAQAMRNAAILLAAGAHMVKLEGGSEFAETVRFLSARGVPVCGHLGLTPQSVHQFGGYRIQGRGTTAASGLLADAGELQQAGMRMVVLEGMPAPVAERVTHQLSIPTIGIGASPACSGQVLVLHDMLDVTRGRKPRFVRNFMADAASVEGAIRAYVEAVRNGSFPGPEHCYPE